MSTKAPLKKMAANMAATGGNLRTMSGSSSSGSPSMSRSQSSGLERKGSIDHMSSAKIPRQPPQPRSESKIVCVMVGLPARGKSYIGQKISRYLNWMGVLTKVFNVGQYRRTFFGANHTHEWFAPDNVESQKLRQHAAQSAADDMLAWLRGSGQVAIYDATNSTTDRRSWIRALCEATGAEVMFIESICNSQTIIMENIRAVKLRSPDYANVDPELAAADFIKRIALYEGTEGEATVAYKSVEENEGSYIQLIDVGRQFIINRINGFLQSRIVYYLMNLHTQPRAIYLTRHGESEFNVSGRIGGDSDLSQRGLTYARALPKFFEKHMDPSTSMTVWTSTFKRTRQTGQFLPYAHVAWRALDELDAGVCDGLTYEEIEKRYPEDFAARDQDKLNYRYRGGESYSDLIVRLEPVIMEMERQTDIIVIGHQAVLRAILAYFLNQPLEELPYVRVPLHTVIKLTPQAYGTKMEEFPLEIEAVDTHRDPRKKGH